MIIRTYNELIRLESFSERYNYLKLVGSVGEATFGFDRYLNQALYRSSRWKKLRDDIIVRDNGCDLALDGYIIYDKILIHHMNPISEEDIRTQNDSVLFNPDFLICVSINTHNAIHFGDERLLPRDPIVRRVGDTKLW